MEIDTKIEVLQLVSKFFLITALLMVFELYGIGYIYQFISFLINDNGKFFGQALYIMNGTIIAIQISIYVYFYKKAKKNKCNECMIVMSSWLFILVGIKIFGIGSAYIINQALLKKNIFSADISRGLSLGRESIIILLYIIGICITAMLIKKKYLYIVAVITFAFSVYCLWGDLYNKNSLPLYNLCHLLSIIIMGISLKMDELLGTARKKHDCP